ncbi:MAG: pullulanase [Mycolicibacter algericus]|uniref:pullulanase n=1 Tax=Mycolicibacter algericus TaxID=1288388 RepID=UPI003C721B22
MDYCLGDGDGAATMWSGPPDLDLDGDGVADAIALDFDGDGLQDDALVDLDGDGVADHLMLDLDDDGAPEASFTDDGSGTWGHGVAAGSADRSGGLRWSGLDDAEHIGGPLVDFDGDGRINDRLLDSDGDGRADRVLIGDGSGGYRAAYVDTDGDGRWDIKLTDADGDGAADGAAAL